MLIVSLQCSDTHLHELGFAFRIHSEKQLLCAYHKGADLTALLWPLHVNVLLGRKQR